MVMCGDDFLSDDVLCMLLIGVVIVVFVVDV